MSTTILLNQFKPDIVLNIGSAGGFDEKTLEVGTVIISDEVRHHDVDVTAFGYAMGQVHNCLLIQIRLAIKTTGDTSSRGDWRTRLYKRACSDRDSFISDSERVKLV